MSTCFTFLLIDDDADTLFLRRRLLERAFKGCTVLEARTPEEALQRTTSITLHAIVADHFIRDQHGADTIRQLLSRSPECPVVIVTNSDDPELRKRALAAGATVVLPGDGDFCRWLQEATR